MDILKELKQAKLVSIMRGVPVDEVVNTVKAMQAGGIKCIEVTFDARSEDLTPTLKSIELIRTTFGDSVLVGAGTVLNVRQVNAAFDAGALYMISPNTDVDVIAETKRLGCVSIPGALTPTEAMTAWNAGADFVKMFPAGVLGTGYIKAVCAPLSHIPFLAVGGINEKNARDFIEAGCVGLGIGDALANKKLIAAHDFARITEIAKAYVDAVK